MPNMGGKLLFHQILGGCIPKSSSGGGGGDGRHIVAEGRRFGTPPLDFLTHSSLLASEKKSQPNQ